MKKIMIIFTMLFGALYFNTAFCMEQNTEAKLPICVDTGVFMPNEDMASIVKNASAASLTLVPKHPIMLCNVMKIKDIAIEISRKTRGMSNIISKLAQELEGRGYGKLNENEQKKIIKIAIAPVVQEKELEIIKQFKAQGHPIIGFTNRDNYEYNICKETIKPKVDLDKVLDGIVTLQCWKTKQNIDPENGRYNFAVNHLITRDPFPQESALKALRQVVYNQTDEFDCSIVIEKEEHFNALQNNSYEIPVFKNLEELQKSLDK